MFAVLYRGYIYPEREQEYQDMWKIVASYFVAHRGARGSVLHRTDAGEYIAYSRWPDRLTRDASWGDKAEAMDADVLNAIERLKACIDRDKPYNEICMDVCEDLLI
jgi:hypothetical protein